MPTVPLIRPPTVSEVKTGIKNGLSDCAASIGDAAAKATLWATGLDDETVSSCLDIGYERGFELGKELRTGTESDLKRWLDTTSYDRNGALPRGDSLVESAQESYRSHCTKLWDVVPSRQTLWNSGPADYLKEGLKKVFQEADHLEGFTDALKAPKSDLPDPNGFVADDVEPGEDSSKESDKYTQ